MQCAQRATPCSCWHGAVQSVVWRQDSTLKPLVVLMLTWCRSECCVTSGLDFEAAGGSVICPIKKSQYKHDVEHSKEHPPTLLWQGALPIFEAKISNQKGGSILVGGGHNLISWCGNYLTWTGLPANHIALLITPLQTYLAPLQIIEAKQATSKA